MTLLHIALQEGFYNDTVIVTVNDSEVFRKTGVKTRLQIGLADTFDLDIADDTATVVVSVPSKGLSGSKSIDLPSPVYLAVSITRAGQVSFKYSSTPYGYV